MKDKDIDKVTQKTIQALLSGIHPLIKKYSGKHVFVIDNEVVLMKTGKKAMIDFKNLKSKYNHRPVLTFVPNPGASYILLSK